MQYVVCYDIADDQRRERLARVLLDFGSRIQESVFLAHLDDTLAANMRERIRKLVDPDLDRVHLFLLCEACSGKVEVLGTAEVPKDQDFYVI
jgi:CRISPR-associated protein Cas2